MKSLWCLGVAAGTGMAAGAGMAGAALIARSRPKDGCGPKPDPIHELAGMLTQCSVLPDIFAAIERSFTSALGFPSAIFMLEGNRLSVSHHSRQFEPDDKDLANARLSISSGRLVAHLTSWPDVHSFFLPLTTWRGTVGSFGFRASGTRGRIPHRIRSLVKSFANQTALAIVRVTLEHEARHVEFLAEADRLQKALLNSIAHNVRTPLASIIGVLSTLQEE